MSAWLLLCGMREHAALSVTDDYRGRTTMESVCSGFMFRTRSWRAAKDGGYEAGFKSNVLAVRPVTACRSMPSRRPRDTPIWKFEAALNAVHSERGDTSHPCTW